MKKFYAWYQKHITGAIFIGLLLGILTGLFLADRFAPVLTVTSLLGGIYMNALNMMIFPLVFCSVVMGICSIGSIKTTGKITGASMVFFLCTTALASLAGLIIPRLIHLGKGVSFEMATSDIAATDMSNILETVKNLIPSNPVAAFAQGNMLQVLVFAVIIGFTLIAVGEKGQPLLNVIDSLNEVCLKIISTIVYFTPIGVFCTIVYRTGCRIKWYRNDHFTGHTADRPVSCILHLCICCIRSCSQNNRQRKPIQILKNNYAGCS